MVHQVVVRAVMHLLVQVQVLMVDLVEVVPVPVLVVPVLIILDQLSKVFPVDLGILVVEWAEVVEVQVG